MYKYSISLSLHKHRHKLRSYDEMRLGMCLPHLHLKHMSCYHMLHIFYWNASKFPFLLLKSCRQLSVYALPLNLVLRSSLTYLQSNYKIAMLLWWIIISYLKSIFLLSNKNIEDILLVNKNIRILIWRNSFAAQRHCSFLGTRWWNFIVGLDSHPNNYY